MSLVLSKLWYLIEVLLIQQYFEIIVAPQEFQLIQVYECLMQVG